MNLKLYTMKSSNYTYDGWSIGQEVIVDDQICTIVGLPGLESYDIMRFSDSDHGCQVQFPAGYTSWRFLKQLEHKQINYEIW